MDRPDTALYFTTVLSFGKEAAMLGGHLYMQGDEPSVTRLMLLHQGRWRFIADLNDVAYAAAYLENPHRPAPSGAAFMGRLGNLIAFEGESTLEEHVSVSGAGYLLAMRRIGSGLFAAGVQNLVYRRGAEGWRRIDDGIFAPLAGRVDRAINTIDGFTDNDVYAAGEDGRIWHWDGRSWTELDSPTNLPFYSILCSGNGLVYVAGSSGLIFCGSRDQGWRDLSNTELNEYVVESMVDFNGEIYVASYYGLYKIVENQLQNVKPSISGDLRYYKLSASRDALWSVGDDIVLRFDGVEWQRFACPDNEPYA